MLSIENNIMKLQLHSYKTLETDIGKKHSTNNNKDGSVPYEGKYRMQLLL